MQVTNEYVNTEAPAHATCTMLATAAQLSGALGLSGATLANWRKRHYFT